MSTRTVADYYDHVQRWFTWYYSDRQSLGLHYGFWERGTKNRAEALVNQYRTMLALLQPQAGQRILDAGCGVGGGCLWLAAHSQAVYDGLTISPVQNRLAQRYIHRRHLTDRVRVVVQDYFHPEFPDQTFQSVFGIESFCHAYPDPGRVFQAMHRILQPGGRLIISDGMLRRRPTNDDERKLVDDFCRGFALDGWNTIDEIRRALEESGFVVIHFIDKTDAIRLSVRDVDRRGRQTRWLLRGLRRLGLVSDDELRGLHATVAQRPLYEQGLFAYGIFVAVRR